jgi:MtrB/PioB family decaheme-associated outer membrane protein
MKRAWLTTTALILLLNAVPARAEDDQDKDQDKVDGSVTAGPQYSGDTRPGGSAKFEEYRDVPGGFIAERFILTYRPRDGFVIDVDARDLSQKDQSAFLQFGRQDRWKAYFNWSENPRRWTDQAKMLYADRGGAVFTLDDTLQAAVQTAPASVDTTPADGEWDAGTKGARIKGAILNSANDVFLGYQRRTGTGGVRFTPTRSWTIDVHADRELRAGTTPQSLGMYFTLSPAEVAAPVDFQTDTATVTAEYARKSWLFGAQISASSFDNNFKSLTWDDQLSLTDSGSATTATPARGRMALWTDNSVRRATVYGGFNLPGHTRVNATVSRSETTQDDPFLPMTTNTLLSPSALPAAALDGKFKNNLAEVRVSSRPGTWFRWNGWVRQYELKNESPSLDFADYVMTDYQITFCANVNSCGSLANRMARRNLPYGYEKTNIGGSAGFHLAQWADLSLGVEREKMKRDFAAVEDSHDDTLKLAADFDVSDWLNLRATVRSQKRRADSYDPEYFEESFPIGEQNVAASNEGMRKFYWTDRDRDSASLLVELTPHPKLSIYMETTYAHDTYLDPVTGKKVGDSFTSIEDRNFDSIPDPALTLRLAGRTNDLNTTSTLGLSGSPSARFNYYADYTRERFKYGLETRYRAPVAGIGSDSPFDDWGSGAHDQYNTANVGFDCRLTKKGEWKMALDGSRSVGRGDIETHFVPGGNVSSDTTLTQFPQLKTVLTLATLSLTHAVSKDLDYTLRYWYESWNEDNWAADQMQPYMGDPGNDPGSVTAVYLGIDFKNYTNNVVSALVRYRF